MGNAKRGDSDEISDETKAKKREIRQKISKAISIAGEQRPTSAIEKCRPEVCVELIEALGRGMTLRECSRKFGMMETTIRGFARRHRELITDIREFISGYAFEDMQRARGILNKKFDMMEDDPEQIAKTNVRDLVQSVSMLGEGYMASVGENKVIVEHRSGPTLEDFRQHLEDMRQKAREKILNAQSVIEIP